MGNEIKAVLLGVVSGATIMGVLVVTCMDLQKIVPNISDVDQGYIAPSRLEIVCQDLDGNHKPETIIRVDKKAYLLREVDGKPVISAYNIKPAEIMPEVEEYKQ